MCFHNFLLLVLALSLQCLRPPLPPEGTPMYYQKPPYSTGDTAHLAAGAAVGKPGGSEGARTEGSWVGIGFMGS